MKKYLVKWEIDIESSNPRDAALQALQMQKDNESEATCFTVIEQSTQQSIDIDLSENPILEQCNKSRMGNYIHVLEVHSVSEIEATIDAIVNENMKEHGLDACIDFFDSMTIISLSEKNEEEIYNFNPQKYIEKNYWT